MTEYIFNSSLSNDEIDDSFKNIDLVSGIMDGLNEALSYEKGSAKAATIARKRSLPNIDVAAERKALNLTQKAFAQILGVSPRTVEAWEAGRTTPSPTARILLYLISLDHSLIHKLQ